jgi:hypothetical protein
MNHGDVKFELGRQIDRTSSTDCSTDCSIPLLVGVDGVDEGCTDEHICTMEVLVRL